MQDNTIALRQLDKAHKVLTQYHRHVAKDIVCNIIAEMDVQLPLPLVNIKGVDAYLTCYGSAK